MSYAQSAKRRIPDLFPWGMDGQVREAKDIYIDGILGLKFFLPGWHKSKPVTTNGGSYGA